MLRICKTALPAASWYVCCYDCNDMHLPSQEDPGRGRGKGKQETNLVVDV